ncbi:MAG: hypothetical protein BAA01_07245 [Bacillus thermozeamaize]|uniref:DUF3887 domain-containing protein n=1 Tax=Bacillus thermozeamaize TaxID=230954 RepID=A0A1Y3PX72_9BACI|nr:MAG: hypothetical protein BAA01_07245 [Bacillus thermozeamaize]
MRNISRAILIVIFLFTLAACNPQDRTSIGEVTVTPEEARQFFMEIINDTMHGRFDRLCQKAVSQTRCQNELRDTVNVAPNELRDMASLAPFESPRIRNIYPAEIAYHLPSGKSPLGQVVVVEGQDRLGRSFATEVFVFRDEGRLVAKNIIWWSGASYSTELPHTTAPKPNGAREPSSSKDEPMKN